ncbi:MAG: tRNA (adenosine(37)-N6)-dimethylallyltransferase MiaA [Bacteroidota bacterium]
MISQRPQIIVLTGPTASGKTAVGITLAGMLDAEIISADSRQVYRGMNIGTAKPGADELSAVPHHGIDVCDPSETYTVGRFFEDSQGWIDDILSRGKRVLVVGGSGLYVRAITDGIFEGPKADPLLRAQLEERILTDGLPALVEELRRLDPATGEIIDQRNPVRVIRALEVCLLTGQRFSELRAGRMPSLSYDAHIAALRWDRGALHERINRRVDEMMADGLVEEVSGLLAAGIEPGWSALNTVGYKEIIGYLSKRMSIDETVEAIKRSTRQYARRQMTWLRKETRSRWIDVDEAMTSEVIARIVLEAGTSE